MKINHLPVCGLLASILLSHVHSQTPVKDYELFVPFDNTVPLGVSNITQFSAQLQWKMPVETRERLKAMRVNCTKLKSLIEPYTNSPPQISLYNPSIVGSRITLHDLQPATKYSCVLVGAISLDVGREKLAILSDIVTFSTLLETGGKETGSGVDLAGIIVGATIPVILIVMGCVSMLIGYHFYRKSSGSRKKSKKYHMRMSKDFGSSSTSGRRNSKQGSKKSKNDQSKGIKKAKKEKPLQRRPSYEKFSGESSKKTSKKKTLDTYELVLYSSEDDLYGHKNELEMGADLGWDPITYYPLPHKVPELASPIQLQDCAALTFADQEQYYYPHHSVQPLY